MGEGEGGCATSGDLESDDPFNATGDKAIPRIGPGPWDLAEGAI